MMKETDMLRGVSDSPSLFGGLADILEQTAPVSTEDEEQGGLFAGLDDIVGTEEEEEETPKQSKKPSFLQKAGATLAEFVEGFTYDRDIFQIDDKVELHPAASYLANMGGEITRMIGLGVGSSATLSLILTVPWINTILSTGGVTANRLLSRLGAKGAAVGTIGSFAAREATEGLIYSIYDQFLAPAERKYGVEGTVMNISQFGWGGVGNLVARSVLRKYFPGAGPGTERLVGFLGDNFLGALGSAPLYEDKRDMIDDMVAAETIAIGIVDMITFSIARGRIKRTPELDDGLERLKRAQVNYDNNKTLANQLDVHDALNDVLKITGIDANPQLADELIRQHLIDFQNDYKKASNQKRKLLNLAKAPSLDDVKGLQQTLKNLGYDPGPIDGIFGDRTKAAVEAFQKDAKITVDGVYGTQTQRTLQEKLAEQVIPKEAVQTGSKVLEEGGVTTSPERADYLAQATPAEGASINTKRMDTAPEVKDLAMQLSDTTHDKTVQTHAETRQQALKMLDDLDNLATEAADLAEVIQKAPAIKHALQETVAAHTGVLLSEAERIKGLGNNATIDDIYSFYTTMETAVRLNAYRQDIDRGAARTINAGNIQVTGATTGRFLNVAGVPEGAPVQIVDSVRMPTTEDVPATLRKNARSGRTLAVIQGAIEKYKNQDGQIDTDRFIKEVIDPLLEASKKGDIEPAFNRWTNAFVEWSNNTLLMGWETWHRNILAQTLEAINEDLTNYTAATLDTTYGTIARLFGVDYKPNVTFTEVNAKLMGDIEGLYRAVFKPLTPMTTVANFEAAIRGEQPVTLLDLTWDRLRNPTEWERLYQLSGFGTKQAADALSPRAFTSSEYLFPNAPDTPFINMVLGAFDWTAAQARLAGFGMLEAGDRFFASSGYFHGLNGELARRQVAGEITPEQAKVLKKRVEAWHNYKILVADAESHERTYGIKLDEAVTAEQIRKATGGLLDGLTVEELQQLEILDRIAMDQSDKMTYKDPFNYAFLQDIEKMRVKYPLLKVILRFLHTPLKIIGRYVERNPLNFRLWQDAVGLTKDANGNVDTRRMIQAQAQLAVSTGLYLLAYQLWQERRLTPTARSPQERRMMEEAGVPENSWKVGDYWIPHGYYDPASMFFSHAANIFRLYHEATDEASLKEADNLMMDLIYSTAQDVLSNTWATSVREFINSIYYRESAKRFLEKQIEIMNPAARIHRNVTTFPGSPWRTKELVDYQGLGKKDLPRLDTFGRPVMNYKYFFGMRYYEPSTDAIDRELMNLGITLQRLPRKVGGVELTDELYYRMQRSLDTHFNAKEEMNKLVEQESYKRATIIQKEKMIKKRWEQLREQAKAFITTEPEYEEAWEKLIQKTIEKGNKEGYLYNWFGN